MAQPFTLDLQGFAEIQDRLRKASGRLVVNVDGMLAKGAGIIARNAARDAPKDEGQLARSISSRKAAPLNHEVVSPVKYSPFIEWGTKRKAKVPAELQSYASQFKGLKTGSAKEALYAIQGWVRRKGIKFDSAGTFKSGKRKGTNKKLTIEQTAYIIFHFIMINGIKPRPFFFHNLNKQQPLILADVRDVLGDIL